MVSKLKDKYSIKVLCQCFDVTRSAYYRFSKGHTYNSDKKYNRPKWEIRREFIENKRRYGKRRIKKALEKKGFTIGINKVRELMAQEGLKAIQPRKFTPKTTDSKHGKKVCDNLLLDRAEVSKPNEVWVSDITYLPLKSGNWAYLVAYLDLYSKQIVGWDVQTHMRESLVREPLEKALLKRNVKENLIIHSDRGGQYLSNNMKKLMQTFGLKQSMSRADECYDNASAESLWSRLKAEMDIPKTGYESLESLKNELFEYIEVYYNRMRLHSSIGYNIPVEFEQNYYKKTG